MRQRWKHSSIFSVAEVDRLVHEVSKHSASFNVENKNRRNVSLKLNEWKMMSEEMNDESSEQISTILL